MVKSSIVDYNQITKQIHWFYLRHQLSLHHLLPFTVYDVYLAFLLMDFDTMFYAYHDTPKKQVQTIIYMFDTCCLIDISHILLLSLFNNRNNVFIIVL